VRHNISQGLQRPANFRQPSALSFGPRSPVSPCGVDFYYPRTPFYLIYCRNSFEPMLVWRFRVCVTPHCILSQDVIHRTQFLRCRIPRCRGRLVPGA
jgi:hypothetical protein